MHTSLGISIGKDLGALKGFLTPKENVTHGFEVQALGVRGGFVV